MQWFPCANAQIGLTLANGGFTTPTWDTPTMLREFIDAEGTLWLVWQVTPITAEGWLCFETIGDRRRLRPIPPEWATRNDGALQYYLARAVSVLGTTQDFASRTPVDGSVESRLASIRNARRVVAAPASGSSTLSGASASPAVDPR